MFCAALFIERIDALLLANAAVTQRKPRVASYAEQVGKLLASEKLIRLARGCGFCSHRTVVDRSAIET